MVVCVLVVVGIWTLGSAGAGGRLWGAVTPAGIGPVRRICLLLLLLLWRLRYAEGLRRRVRVVDDAGVDAGCGHGVVVAVGADAASRVAAVVPRQAQALGLLVGLPLRLLGEQLLLVLRHLEPDPHACQHGDDTRHGEQGVLDRRAVLFLHQEHAEVDQDELLGQGQEGRDGEMPELDIAG